ncbi:hypothetical protein PC123_g14497 [Phytophthora cactorum]|nr:hypothetical protein PC123_g14497 [Phytophthora cactorum]
MKVTGRPVEVSAGETASSGKTAPEAKQGLAHLASEVSAVFATVCFRTKFYHKVSTKGIYFEEVVGYVAGHAWLNDAVVSYVSDVITASQVGVHVLSSFVVDYEKFPSPPRSTFISMKFIVLPANIKRSHWTLIVVAVHRYGVMTMHMYDSYVLHRTEHGWRRYGPINCCHISVHGIHSGNAKGRASLPGKCRH